MFRKSFIEGFDCKDYRRVSCSGNAKDCGCRVVFMFVLCCIDLEKQQKSETEQLLQNQALLLQQQQQDQHERERITKERKGVHQMQQSVLNEHGKEFVKKG